MDRSKRKRFYNLCDPAEPLALGDERYADVDAFGARGPSWTDEVARLIELSDRPVCQLVTAPAGTGLTTELRRLAARLRDRADLLPVHIEAKTVVDLWSPIDSADLLLAIVERTERAIADQAGKPWPSEPLRRFRKWIEVPEILALKTGSSSAAVSAGIVDILRDVPRARAKVRARIDADRSRFFAEVRDELTLLAHAARRLGHTGIAVLFDGLEKLGAITSELTLVLDSAERTFGRDISAMSLPVHVVYTLPFSLLLRLETSPRVLPAIALFDRQGRRREAGFQAAREIVERRAPAPILDELFGPEHRAARIDQLIASSGGTPREIVGRLQNAIAHPALDGTKFALLLAMDADWLRRGIPEPAAAWLAGIHRSKSLGSVDPTERHIAESMLARGAVLPYRNGEAWVDLHPAVLRAPAVIAAMDGLVGPHGE